MPSWEMSASQSVQGMLSFVRTATPTHALMVAGTLFPPSNWATFPQRGYSPQSGARSCGLRPRQTLYPIRFLFAMGLCW